MILMDILNHFHQYLMYYYSYSVRSLFGSDFNAVILINYGYLNLFSILDYLLQIIFKVTENLNNWFH